MAAARNPELHAAIRAAMDKHEPFVSKPLLRRVALSVVAHWIGQQSAATMPAVDAMQIAQDAIKRIDSHFKPKTGESRP